MPRDLDIPLPFPPGCEFHLQTRGPDDHVVHKFVPVREGLHLRWVEGCAWWREYIPLSDMHYAFRVAVEDITGTELYILKSIVAPKE